MHPLARTEVDNELEDLEARDPFLPPDANATRALEIVPVHHHMDRQVQRDDDPRDRRRANKLGVAKERRGAVMVAVQERQGLLLEEEEARVEQLEVLGQVVQLNRTAVSTMASELRDLRRELT